MWGMKVAGWPEVILLDCDRTIAKSERKEFGNDSMLSQCNDKNARKNQLAGVMQRY
jgi:hypothetical protein